MHAQRHTIVLVDQDVPGDRRVERVVAEAGPSCAVLDLRAWDGLGWARRALDLLSALKLMTSWLVDSPARKEGSLLEVHPRHHALAGLVACVRWTARALAAARQLDDAASAPRLGLLRVHANDLAAALAVTLATRKATLELVYDSHELQIHRHRRAGSLRTIIEHAQERRVVQQADEVRTVNGAIARAMVQLHPPLRDKPPQVVTNDLFDHYEIHTPSERERPALVYIGRATRGRQLQRLARLAPAAGFEVHGWLLGSVRKTDPAVGSWRRGAAYETELAALCRKRRCLMWCCLDASSQSYRLATPNKLFQALAMGMPVLASRATYLAELVDRYGIGAVDDGDLRVVGEQARGPRYVEWQENIARFRRDLREGRTAI